MKQQATIAESIRSKLGNAWIPAIYLDRVRQQRTRAFHLDIPNRENKPEILHTLLGIELKVGNRRFACPDLATARYMLLFARLGVQDFAVPYDITKISVIADELETAWQRLLLLIDNEELTATAKTRLHSALTKRIRNEINEIGPGEMMPKFDRPTRQRAK